MCKIFIPCGGPDTETDEVPGWVQSISTKDVCENIDKGKLPVIPGNGISSEIKKGYNYFLALCDQFREGDIVVFNGEKLVVFSISVDFMSDL